MWFSDSIFRFITANRTVRAGLTASAVISVSYQSCREEFLVFGCSTDEALKVMALEHSYDWINTGWICLRSGRTILVRCGL